MIEFVVFFSLGMGCLVFFQIMLESFIKTKEK